MQTATKPTPRFRNLSNSPWGRVQRRTTIAKGIVWMTTAGHGGFRLSRDRWEAMPAHLKACSFTSDEFFEEDCAYCAVVLAFPAHFNDEQVKSASATYARWFANA